MYSESRYWGTNRISRKGLWIDRKAKKYTNNKWSWNRHSFEKDFITLNSEIIYDAPGADFLLGQIGWAPIEDTIHGKIVFDWAVSGGGEAELGVLKNNIMIVTH